MRTDSLFGDSVRPVLGSALQGKDVERLRRLDLHGDLRRKLLPFCRLKCGEIWEDKVLGHRVGVLDATKPDDVAKLSRDARVRLVVNDPPYNVAVGGASTDNLSKVDLKTYLEFSERWVRNVLRVMDADSHLYVWMGADCKDGFQPLPDFIVLMRQFSDLRSRNLITMRNQRGYGTQRNWMWVRQELLYYTRGNPEFNVEAEYTDIPKILRGYYKFVNGKLTENGERSKSQFIRAGNVWVDIQQVFYRMEENVSGCYAQKPLKAIERIVMASSAQTEVVLDLFAHSGTTLVAAERLGRRCYTADIDPVFAEISIRRLEHFRKTGRTGWQFENPFPELDLLTRAGGGDELRLEGPVEKHLSLDAPETAGNEDSTWRS